MSLLDISAVDLRSILSAAVLIAGLPIVRNIIARNEHKRHTIENTLGSKQIGVYVFAVFMLSASTLRDAFFQRAIAANPPERVLPIFVKQCAQTACVLKAMSVALVGLGTTLVLSSFLRLGITGACLGEYFGIRTKRCETKFPFSYFRYPMCLGATMNYLGASVAQNSGVGIVLTAWSALVYGVTAAYLECPFVKKMYANGSHSSEKITNKSKNGKKDY